VWFQLRAVRRVRARGTVSANCTIEKHLVVSEWSGTQQQ
jgi:hypothetical protein